jgi:NADH-quinone oxidoreductase subunit C
VTAVSTEPVASAALLHELFGAAIRRVDVVCGDTIVLVQADRLFDVLSELKGNPAFDFNYLTDVTAVEYRDAERPIEIVYQLRSLRRKEDLRLKAHLPEDALEVETVTGLWAGADWLEREVYDMFGIRFIGHPDLRRILMWETYGEGYPLRKSFPLRGHFSRAEQTRQALAANPEAHYSLEELDIAAAAGDLPAEMRERLAKGERGLVP